MRDQDQSVTRTSGSVPPRFSDVDSPRDRLPQHRTVQVGRLSADERGVGLWLHRMRLCVSRVRERPILRTVLVHVLRAAARPRRWQADTRSAARSDRRGRPQPVDCARQLPCGSAESDSIRYPVRRGCKLINLFYWED
jgi:hypothetical protein